MAAIWQKLQQATGDGQFVSFIKTVLTLDPLPRSRDDEIISHPYLQARAVAHHTAAAPNEATALASPLVQPRCPDDKARLATVPGMPSVLWDPKQAVCHTSSGTVYRCDASHLSIAFPSSHVPARQLLQSKTFFFRKKAANAC